MLKATAIDLLMPLHDELAQRFGVERLDLFGSVARGEATDDSDIDVLVRFSVPASFDRYYGLLHFLEERLGRRVDLVTDKSLHPRLRPQVEREAIRVA
jgi:hypothetical protein